MSRHRANDDYRTAQILTLIGKQQVAIAELEAMGLPLRIINLLEAHLGIIWLEELLAYTPQQLKARVPNLGDKSLQLILEAIRRLAKVMEPLVRPLPPPPTTGQFAAEPPPIPPACQV